LTYFGLDDEIGPMSFYDSSGENEWILGKPYSENMANLIDTEVQNLIN